MKNSRTVNYAVNVANLPIIFARKCADFAQCVCNLLAVPNVIICIVVYGYQDSGTTLFPRILWLKVMVIKGKIFLSLRCCANSFNVGFTNSLTQNAKRAPFYQRQTLPRCPFILIRLLRVYLYRS